MSAAAQYGADLQASHRRMAYGWIYPMGVVNVLLYAVQLAANQLAATGTLFGKSVGDVSALNETRLTPAGYAFSIWFVIYVLLLVRLISVPIHIVVLLVLILLFQQLNSITLMCL